MEQVITEGSAGINRFGKDLLNVIRKAKGGEFPVTVTDAEIKSALSEMNRDVSDSTVRLAAKALEREGVRTPVPAGTIESDASKLQADLLISGAMKGLTIQESLTVLREGGGGKTKARQSAEKMARKAGKSEGDKDWEKTVDKFEKNQESVTEQELKGTEGLVTALKDAVAEIKKTGGDATKKKVPEWEKLLKTFEKKESIEEDAAGDLDKMREKLDKMATAMKDPKAKAAADAIRKELGKLKGMVKG